MPGEDSDHTMPVIGVDVGGTFTDSVLLRESDGVTIAKASTTADPVDGVWDSLARLADAIDSSVEALLADADAFFHATTLATNILIEENGATIGLLTTKGHEDAQKIGRIMTRHAGLSTTELKDYVNQSKQPPFADPERTKGINERVDCDGQEVVSLSIEEVVSKGEQLVASGAEIIAINYLWSFANPEHERQSKVAIEEQFDVPVVLSSDISPRMGEYERGATTAVSAYVAPRLQQYISTLEQQLHDRGLTAPFLIMQSNGGVVPSVDIESNEASMLLSGPAAGVTGAANGEFDAATSSPNVICTDVGGTSFDVGLVVDGEPEATPSQTVNKHTLYQQSIQIETIGSGGGSIAWLGSENELNIGPRSAGADPGPACYENGNTEPTITDADLVLGLLDPEYFLGGELEVSLSAAQAAIREQIAEPLDVSVPDAARGVYALMNAKMADLIRHVTVENGFDPADFMIFAYGGAGPMHAAGYCQELGIDSLTVPLGDTAAAFSAYGLTTADVRRAKEVSKPVTEPFDAEWLADVYRDLFDQVLSAMDAPAESLELSLTADMRYEGQYSELTVELPATILDGRTANTDLKAYFEESYAARYGQSALHRNGTVEIISQRLTATRPVESGTLPELPAGADAGTPSKVRDVIWETGELETEIYFDQDVVAGQTITGPAVLQLPSTTIPVPPAASANLTPHGSFTVDLAKGGE